MKRYTPVALSDFESLLRTDRGWVKNTVSNEVVFDKKLVNGTTLRVYTTIPASGDGSECRGCGVDAVRYCAFNETKRYLSRKSKRVLRTAGWQGRLQEAVTKLFFELRPATTA